MKLYPLTLVRLQHLEVGQFIIRFLNDFQNLNLDPATDLDFKKTYDSLVTQSPVFDAALKQIRAKSETELLIAKDTNRDNAVRTLRRALSVAEFTDVETEKIAYKKISIILKTYKNIEVENYEAESLGLDNLVAELRNPKNLPDVQLLGLDRYINKVEETNSIFKATFDNRSSSTITTEVYDTKLLRKNILETYTKLAKYTLAMAENKDNPFYKDTLNVLNNGRKYFADLVAKRVGTASTDTTAVAPQQG
ncbi:DUF6261 family protein [Flavobacterium oreochromis]|uniref:DUF6261 family protein n=1 Tax=Flavobacterium oreochromis TaxID=2906078 RepID=UPI00385F45AB